MQKVHQHFLNGGNDFQGMLSVSQKLNGTDSQRTPLWQLRSSYDRYSGLKSGSVRFFGSCGLEISWMSKNPNKKPVDLSGKSTWVQGPRTAKIRCEKKSHPSTNLTENLGSKVVNV